jgi:hypothetical protein
MWLHVNAKLSSLGRAGAGRGSKPLKTDNIVPRTPRTQTVNFSALRPSVREPVLRPACLLRSRHPGLRLATRRSNESCEQREIFQRRCGRDDETVSERRPPRRAAPLDFHDAARVSAEFACTSRPDRGARTLAQRRPSHKRRSLRQRLVSEESLAYNGVSELRGRALADVDLYVAKSAD